MNKKPALLPSIIAMKCPNCRKGKLFTRRSYFPLGKLLEMPEKCPECGQKTELQTGFYFGTGYVSYALSVAFLLIYFFIYKFTIGISIKDNSVLSYLFSGIGILMLLQPWLMRMSRVLYIYMFVKYGSHQE